MAVSAQRKSTWRELIQPCASSVSCWGDVSSPKKCESCCLMKGSEDLLVRIPRCLFTLFLFIV